MKFFLSPIFRSKYPTPDPTPFKNVIDHFAILCLVAWPLSESEAGIDFVLIQTRGTNPPAFHILIMLNKNYFIKKQG